MIEIYGEELIKLVALFSSGLCMGLGGIGAAAGVGITGAGASEYIAKREDLQNPIMKNMLIGMSITSSHGIFALIVGILLLRAAGLR